MDRKVPLSTKKAVGKAIERAEKAICLELSGHQCESCGTTRNLSWAHIVKRGRKSLAYDRNNSLILCIKKDSEAKWSCHWEFDNAMTDRQRYRFVQKLFRVRGGEWGTPEDPYDYLDVQIKLPFELNLAQMKLLLEEKKEELRELRGAK